MLVLHHIRIDGYRLVLLCWGGLGEEKIEISLLQISFTLFRYWCLKERGVEKLFDLPSPSGEGYIRQYKCDGVLV